MVLESACQWMVTSAITVNTSITKTSTLFVINKGVPGLGLGESSWEGLCMAGLLVL